MSENALNASSRSTAESILEAVSSATKNVLITMDAETAEAIEKICDAAVSAKILMLEKKFAEMVRSQLENAAVIISNVAADKIIKDIREDVIKANPVQEALACILKMQSVVTFEHSECGVSHRCMGDIWPLLERAEELLTQKL